MIYIWCKYLHTHTHSYTQTDPSHNDGSYGHRRLEGKARERAHIHIFKHYITHLQWIYKYKEITQTKVKFTSKA